MSLNIFMATLLSLQPYEKAFIPGVSSALHKVSLAVYLISRVLFGLALMFAASLLVYGIAVNDQQPSFFGRQAFVVTSGSMAPEFNTGDLIFNRSATATMKSQLHVGDVVTFREPNNDTLLVTHRIVEIQVDKSGSRLLVTKGDANQSNDLTKTPVSNVIGVYESSIPKIGFLMNAKKIQFLLLFFGIAMTSAHFASKIFYSLITPPKESIR